MVKAIDFGGVTTDDATIVDARLTRLAARQMSINRGPCFVG
jgi:hypothetical protein